MAKEHETVADIIAEMRGDGHTGPADALEWVRVKLEHYADRLEAAHKRMEWTHKKELETKDAVIQTEVATREAERKAHKREIDELKKQVGNTAKLREALKDIGRIVEQIRLLYSDYPIETHEIARKASAALDAPSRNCDTPLVVDGPADNNADKAWLVFKRHNPDAYFDVSGLLRCIDWLLAPATEKEGGTK